MGNPQNIDYLNYCQKGKTKEFKILATIARLLMIIWSIIVLGLGAYLIRLAFSNDYHHGMAGFYSMLVGVVVIILGILIVVLIIISFIRNRNRFWTASALFFGFVTSFVFFGALFIVGAIGFVLCITALSLLILSKTQGIYRQY
ncbi:MAG: hypothetical protein JSV09_05670 [Thermoplasmata archaeon]|nr:MAG: hypothetical protein JSV09_05670 [Thermoplasmata archaeon]